MNREIENILDNSSSRVTIHAMQCPTCGRSYIPPKRIDDGINLFKAGVRLSAAARACGVSKQRLGEIIKAKGIRVSILKASKPRSK